MTNKQTQDSSLPSPWLTITNKRTQDCSLPLNLPAMAGRPKQSLRDFVQSSTTSCPAPKDCALNFAVTAPRTSPGLRPELYLDCLAWLRRDCGQDLAWTAPWTSAGVRRLKSLAWIASPGLRPGLCLDCALDFALIASPDCAKAAARTLPGLSPGLQLECLAWSALPWLPRPGTRQQDIWTVGCLEIYFSVHKRLSGCLTNQNSPRFSVTVSKIKFAWFKPSTKRKSE